MSVPALSRSPASRWPYRAAVLLGFAAFNLVLFNRYFPLCEGWWEAYGYLYRSGLRPYRDFELAYTPLYTLYNAGLLSLVGDSMFALRLVAVGALLLELFLLHLLVEQFASPRASAVAVTLAGAFLMYQPEFTPKDYRTYLWLLVVITVLLHVRLAGKTDWGTARRLAGAAAVGVSAAVVLLVKQNVGALLLAAIAASVPLFERKRPVAMVAALLAGFALTLGLMLPIVTPAAWRALLVANDSKGSLGTVLGRFWLDRENRRMIVGAVAIAACAPLVPVVLAPPAAWSGIWSARALGWWQRPVVRRVAYLAAVGLIAASGNTVRVFLSRWLISLALAILGLAAWRVAQGLRDRAHAAAPQLAAVVLPSLSLAYANTTTARMELGSVHIPVAIAVGCALAWLEARTPLRIWLLAALALVIVVPEAVAAKVRVPFDWWRHRQGSILTATEEPAYPQLRGIRVTPEYRDVLARVQHAVETYSKARDDVFFYDLPVFYWLHGKLPPFRTVVQWFDVTPTRELEADLRAMVAHPPRLVVAIEPPSFAYAEHSVMRGGRRLPQADFRDQMDRWVAEGKYHLVSSTALSSNPHGPEPQLQDILVQNDRAIGASLPALVASAGIEAELLEVRRRGEDVPLRTPLAAGDVVKVNASFASIHRLSDLLGDARGDPRDFHTVNIYVRADALGTGGR